jgi:hypothetical protein
MGGRYGHDKNSASQRKENKGGRQTTGERAQGFAWGPAWTCVPQASLHTLGYGEH